MLNRRILRIKAMQALYAFEQCKEANYQLCLEGIEQHFAPDLNSMEPQDKKLLDKQKKKALSLFKKHFNDLSQLPDADSEIVDLLNNQRKNYDKQVDKDLRYFKKQIVIEVEQIYSLYIQVLALLGAFADAASADKKIDHSNFTRNRWIKALKEDKILKAEFLKYSQWDKSFNEVRAWFKDLVRSNDSYLAYLDRKNPDDDAQLNILIHISRKIILAKGIIFEYFEARDLHWTEDKDAVKSLVDKTLKSFKPGESEIQLQTLSPNWEDDKAFFEKLFQLSTSLPQIFKDLIASNTKNWEVERLPLTDRVILEMAVTELLNFPNIPVKVTINEYIELSKKYSTDKSRQFINGILDVISKKLKSDGHLKKSGRGLIDNK